VDVRCRTAVVGQVPVLMVSGEIDLASVPTLRGALVRLVGDAPGSVVAVDLDGVTVVDDTGLGVLLGGAAHARRTGGDLVVVCRAGAVRDLLELSGLARAIEVRDRLVA